MPGRNYKSRTQDTNRPIEVKIAPEIICQAETPEEVEEAVAAVEAETETDPEMETVVHQRDRPQGHLTTNTMSDRQDKQVITSLRRIITSILLEEPTRRVKILPMPSNTIKKWILTVSCRCYSKVRSPMKK